jgi:hypothetical protein
LLYVLLQLIYKFDKSFPIILKNKTFTQLAANNA